MAPSTLRYQIRLLLDKALTEGDLPTIQVCQSALRGCQCAEAMARQAIEQNAREEASSAEYSVR